MIMEYPEGAGRIQITDEIVGILHKYGILRNEVSMIFELVIQRIDAQPVRNVNEDQNVR